MMIRRRLGSCASILLETFHQWAAERAPRMAAALAFYTIFSLAPLLIIVVAIVGFAFGQEAAQGRIVGQIEHLIGADGARTVEDLIESAHRPSIGAMATVLGIAAMLFGASGVFGELQDSLNTIWKVKAAQGGGILEVLRSRFISFAMVIGTGFLLLVSLTLSAGLSALADFTGRQLPLVLPAIQLLDLSMSFIAVTMLFALLYRLVPDAEIDWRDVLPGAAATSLLFIAGKQAISFYLGHSSLSSAYGAVGSLVVMLLWVYYSAQILLFGAALTQVCTTRRRRVRPSPGAQSLHSLQAARGSR